MSSIKRAIKDEPVMVTDSLARKSERRNVKLTQYSDVGDSKVTIYFVFAVSLLDHPKIFAMLIYQQILIKLMSIFLKGKSRFG